jgi:hypothetical protein
LTVTVVVQAQQNDFLFDPNVYYPRARCDI